MTSVSDVAHANLHSASEELETAYLITWVQIDIDAKATDVDH